MGFDSTEFAVVVRIVAAVVAAAAAVAEHGKVGLDNEAQLADPCIQSTAGQCKPD